MTRPCRWHLPANQPCPYEAVYRLWFKALQLVRRDVCAFHLAPAIDEAISMSRVDEQVLVSTCLLDDGRRSLAKRGDG